MSATYADRLSDYPNKGVCGLAEKFDTRRALESKINKLAKLVRQSRHTVVLTGAGISTAAGIPDFRGPKVSPLFSPPYACAWSTVQCAAPNVCSHPLIFVASLSRNKGIWTLDEQKKKKEKKASKRRKLNCQTDADSDVARGGGTSGKANFSFIDAKPTYTHRALAHLVSHSPPDEEEGGRKFLHYVITQNVDGLHRKTHLPRSSLSVLHGCVLTEKCEDCSCEHIRDFEVQSIAEKHTGRHCTLGGTPPGTCGGLLRDTLLDWEGALPKEDWIRAQEECARAELIIALGTSLRIEPCNHLSMYATKGYERDVVIDEPEGDRRGTVDCATSDGKRSRGEVRKQQLGCVIVNLQETLYDQSAELVINGRVDDVMRGLMERLGYGADTWDVASA